MKALNVLALLVLTACGADPSVNDNDVQQAARRPDTQEPAADGEGEAEPEEPSFACEPGRRFCDGSALWDCTRLGIDAVLVVDCATTGPGAFCEPNEEARGARCTTPPPEQ